MVVASLLASLVALLAAAPAPAPAAEKALWGPTALPDGSSPFALYQQLGIDTLQLSMRWADVAATRPAAPADPADAAYRWPAEIDVAAIEAARRGIRLSLLVARTRRGPTASAPSCGDRIARRTSPTSSPPPRAAIPRCAAG